MNRIKLYLVTANEMRMAFEGEQEFTLLLRQRESAYQHHHQQQIFGPGGAASRRPFPEVSALRSGVRGRVLAIRRTDWQTAAVIARKERTVVLITYDADRQVFAVASRSYQQRDVHEDRFADANVPRGK